MISLITVQHLFSPFLYMDTSTSQEHERMWCYSIDALFLVEPIDLQRINIVHVFYISKCFKWIFTFICTRYLCCGFLSFLCCFGFCLLLKQRRTKIIANWPEAHTCTCTNEFFKTFLYNVLHYPTKRMRSHYSWHGPLIMTWKIYHDSRDTWTVSIILQYEENCIINHLLPNNN